MTTQFRLATLDDAECLAHLNAQFIRDSGHRNPMTLLELKQRMRDWLVSEYRAVLFEKSGEIAGYALFRNETAFVYLRQFFVLPAYRRQRIGQQALAWLWANAWTDAQRLRIDVLVGNVSAQRFWHAVGLRDYCTTMEMEFPTSASS